MALYASFGDARSRNCAVTEEMLIKTKLFDEKRGITDFASSHGWLVGIKGIVGSPAERSTVRLSDNVADVATGRVDLKDILSE